MENMSKFETALQGDQPRENCYKPQIFVTEKNYTLDSNRQGIKIAGAHVFLFFF
jgi:hypothetical protein